MSSCAA